MEYYSKKLNEKSLNFLIQKINRQEFFPSLEEEINLSAYIIKHKEEFYSNDLFYLEECHQSILNWIWYKRKNLTPQNIDFNQLIDLLFNVIIIFEYFPIQLEILNNCHLIKKLKDIKNCIKDYNIPLTIRIGDLINYLENQSNNIKNKSLLKKKRRREIEFDLSDNETVSSLINDNEYEFCDTSYSINSKKKYKRVSWKKPFIEEYNIYVDQEPRKM